jgi:hypothetical protein
VQLSSSNPPSPFHDFHPLEIPRSISQAIQTSSSPPTATDSVPANPATELSVTALFRESVNPVHDSPPIQSDRSYVQRNPNSDAPDLSESIVPKVVHQNRVLVFAPLGWTTQSVMEYLTVLHEKFAFLRKLDGEKTKTVSGMLELHLGE